MKLTTTRNLILKHKPDFLLGYRFDKAYPSIDGDAEVSVKDILNNGINDFKDALWVLRATKQDSGRVVSAFVEWCEIRANEGTIFTSAHGASASLCAAASASETANSLTFAESADAADAAATAELNRQKQYLEELLK